MNKVESDMWCSYEDFSTDSWSSDDGDEHGSSVSNWNLPDVAAIYRILHDSLRVRIGSLSARPAH